MIVTGHFLLKCESVKLFEREYGMIRRMIRAKNYVLTYHAFDEVIADNLHEQDIENIVLNGMITRREIDKLTRESKFVLYGPTTQGLDAEVVAKIKGTEVIITVYLL